MKCSVLAFIASLLFISSCFNNSQIKKVITPEYTEARLDSVNIMPSLLLPVKMACNQKLLVILDLSTDTIFRIFTLPDLKYSGWFGKKGRGPREYYYIDPSGFRFYDKYLQIVDLRNIYLMDFPTDIVIDNYNIKEKFSIPGELLTYNFVFKLDNNSFCGLCQTLNSARSLDKFDYQTKEISSIISYPDLIKNVPENAKRALYSFSVDVKPELSHFVMVYNFFPLIRICDSKGIINHQLMIRNLPEQIVFQNLGSRESNLLSGTIYYEDVKTTNNYIYLLYKPRKGFKVDEHSYELYSIGSNEIHIMDWDGNFVRRIKADQNILSFTPSIDDAYIYFTKDNNDRKIFRINIKAIN
jgi:hypothetical protein